MESTEAWERVSVKLPNGMYRLQIKATRGKRVLGKSSGVLVDDVSIWPCEKYSKHSLNTKLGTIVLYINYITALVFPICLYTLDCSCEKINLICQKVKLCYRAKLYLEQRRF